jgi:hypothetical protein
MHVCVAAQEKYNQWQIPTVIFIVSSIGKILFIILVFSIITYYFQPSYYIQAALIYSLLIYTAYSYFSYCIKVTRQMASILGIKIF